MKMIVVVNGHPQSGKDSFVRYCWHEVTVTGSLSIYEYDTVGTYKEIFRRYLGWDGLDKSKRWRAAMAKMKQLDIEYRNGPFIDFRNFFERLPDYSVLFTYIREKEEVDKIRFVYPNLKTVMVVRYEGAEPPRVISFKAADYGNPADNNVMDIDYDHIINNCIGDPSRMRNMAKAFVRHIKERMLQ